MIIFYNSSHSDSLLLKKYMCIVFERKFFSKNHRLSLDLNCIRCALKQLHDGRVLTSLCEKQ